MYSWAWECACGRGGGYSVREGIKQIEIKICKISFKTTPLPAKNVRPTAGQSRFYQYHGRVGGGGILCSQIESSVQKQHFEFIILLGEWG